MLKYFFFFFFIIGAFVRGEDFNFNRNGNLRSAESFRGGGKRFDNLLIVEEHLPVPSRARKAALMKRNGKRTPTIKTLGKTDR